LGGGARDIRQRQIGDEICADGVDLRRDVVVGEEGSAVVGGVEGRGRIIKLNTGKALAGRVEATRAEVREVAATLSLCGHLGGVRDGGVGLVELVSRHEVGFVAAIVKLGKVDGAVKNEASLRDLIVGAGSTLGNVLPSIGVEVGVL